MPVTGALGATIDASALYSLAADTILFTHVSFAAFIVGGLILVYVGWILSWKWVRNPWFRVAHIIGIGIVVLQSWFGLICPLTIWEMNLRAKAGKTIYEDSFITHWLNQILYYQAPPWVFVVCYTVFGGLVLFSWFVVRPDSFSLGNQSDASRKQGK